MTAVKGVLITGTYGTGKTSVCEELAELLEAASVAYGAIDLDWLGWFNAPHLDTAAARHVELANLSAVVTNYIAAGVTRLVLAGSVRSNEEFAALRAAVALPLKTVRLTVPIDEIERRLSTSVTIGRERDLQNAARWLRESIGTDVGDLVLANDRPIRYVAEAVLGWLRWI